MLFRVDPGSPEPLFAQLAAAVRAELVRGALAPGDRLPAARELAGSLEINLHTVLRAYQELRDEGLVELRRGRGAVIRAGAEGPGALRDDVQRLVADARRLGVAPSTLIALVRQEYPS
jgi:GntR family transcriptional regulator